MINARFAVTHECDQLLSGTVLSDQTAQADLSKGSRTPIEPASQTGVAHSPRIPPINNVPGNIASP
jgi:hypothetical protein